MARTSARNQSTLPDGGLPAVLARVRSERAIAVRALGLDQLNRGAQAELLAELGRAGLEHTGQALRVPLREQLRELVTQAGAEGIAESALTREVKGARNAAELRLVLRQLVDEGLLAYLADGGAARLALRGEQLLDEAELDEFGALAAHLAALARATKPLADKPRATLARAALEAPLRALSALLRGREAQRPERVKDALHAAFLAAPSSTGLIHVPDVVRALERLYPRAALLAASMQLAQQGALELRPEASIGRLAAEDRARCPRALDGTPLSCARIRQPAEEART